MLLQKIVCRVRNGPSQQRRCEGWSAAKNASEEASEKDTLVAEKAQLDVKEYEEKSETDSQAASAEQATQQAEKVIDEFCSDQSFSENTGSGLDFQLYILLLKYWDSSKGNEAEDALNYNDEKLRYNFIRYKVDEADRVYKIDELRRSGEAFEIKL